MSEPKEQRWGIPAAEAIKQLATLPETTIADIEAALMKQAAIAASYGDTPELIASWLRQYQTDMLTGAVKLTDNTLNAIAHAAFKAWWDQPEKRVVGSSSDCVLGPRSGDSVGAFPLGEVSLFQGSSGSGKTTIGVDMLIQQRTGEPFWGRETFEREFMVVMMDRSQASLERTFKRMNLDLGELPHRVLSPEDMLRDPAQVLQEIWSQYPQTQIFFVEGLDIWCKDITDMRTVVKLLTPLRHFATARHLAVIRSVGSPKMKARDGYKAPRDRAIGSSVWARMIETVLDIVEDQETEARHVTLLTRDAHRQKFSMRFEGGRLVYPEAAIPVRIDSHSDAPESWRTKMPTIPEIMEQRGVKRTKAYKILQTLKEGKE